MSVHTTKVPLYAAEKAARIVKDMLEPYCEKVMIVGSIRRKKVEVGDMEICLIAKRDIGEPSFFEDPKPGPVCKGFREVINSFHRVKGSVEGRYLQLTITIKWWHKEIGDCSTLFYCDIFMPEPKDWGRMVAIRTGSSDYSKRVIAAGWRKKGWVGSYNGLRRENESEYNDKSRKWICKTTNPTLPPIFDTEEIFFNFLGIPVISPEQRI